MTLSYTEECGFAQLDTGSSNWGAEWNSILEKMDEGCGLLTFIAGEALEEGEVVYVNTTDNKVYLADADALATLPGRGLVHEDAEIDAEVRIRFFGWMDYSVHNLAATAGDILYVSSTAGRLTTTAPSFAQIMGVVKEDSLSGITRVFINPSLKINSDMLHVMVAVEALATGTDITNRPIFAHPQKCELISIAVLSQGVPTHPVSPSTSVVITIADDASNTIVTKSYSAGSPFPSNDYASVGSLSATHKILNAAEHCLLTATLDVGASLPAFLLLFTYKLRNS